VTLAIGFQTLLYKGQQEVLNPEGINCFRFFEGRGIRLSGPRTLSSDPEWKYVNLRRYFAFLQHSIDRGTLWAIFEPNGEALWRTCGERSTRNAFSGLSPSRAPFCHWSKRKSLRNPVAHGNPPARELGEHVSRLLGVIRAGLVDYMWFSLWLDQTRPEVVALVGERAASSSRMRLFNELLARWHEGDERAARLLSPEGRA
jgi:hypothetical protein